ncbi:hypothetical protein BDC45DRAFT_525326 [Circinella umbellata]|nr:hypothetical protein BDC45DRAFT_525326 [Circinella umbellata]
MKHSLLLLSSSITGSPTIGGKIFGEFCMSLLTSCYYYYANKCVTLVFFFHVLRTLFFHILYFFFQLYNF